MNEDSRPAANGCAVAAGAGLFAVSLCAVALILVGLLVLRSCSVNARYTVRITEATDQRVCIEMADGHPSAINGCGQWVDYVDLPRTVEVGRCVVLEEYHPLLRFVEFAKCPG